MYGDKCRNAHTLHPEAAEQKLEYSTECCICQEDVLKAGKRFGLMQSFAPFSRQFLDCSHVFCLECIRNWRYSHIGDPSVRRCPLCRATSFYIIPSKEPVFDPDAKQKIIEAYKKNMSRRNSEELRGRNPVQVFQRRNGRLSLRGVVLLFAQAGQWAGVRAANRYAGRRRAARHRTCMIVEMAK